MKTLSLSPKRSDARYGDIADKIRAEIVCGKWTPGSKLPTWDVLCDLYAVGRPTLTRALALLKAEGFISAKTTRGTFVTENPPNRNRYILIFPSEPGLHGAGGWNLFWESIAMQALSAQENYHCQIDIRFHVTPHADCPAYAELLEDMQKHRIAGVLVVNGDQLTNWEPPFPFPHVLLFASNPNPNLPSVGVNWNSFHKVAARIMMEGKRRRVAVLAGEQHLANLAGDELVKSGLSVPECFRLSMPGTYAEGAYNLVRLLLSLPKTERPDGLLVCDDNLLPETLSAVMTARLSIPDDLLVVAHGNSPASPRAAIPAVRRLGFDVHDILRNALHILQAQQKKPKSIQSIAVDASDQLSFPL